MLPILARLAAPLLSATLATAASADPVTFDTANGPMELPAIPETIVALDVSALDTITALGVIPDGVVTPLFVDYLPDAVEEAPAMGSLFEPDFERIAAMQPDIVVVGVRGAAQAEALSRIAPTAVMSVGSNALEDGLARLEGYGRMLGREDRAAVLAADLEEKIAEARALVQDTGGTALIVMTNGPKLSTFGSASRFGWLHSALGWEQAMPDIDTATHGEAISFEFIAEADPDTLIVIDRGQAVGDGSASAQATLDNELIDSTTAAREGRILFISPAEAYVASGGIQAINRTLDEIIAALGDGG